MESKITGGDERRSGMLETLKFVLSDFWVFYGTVILIYVSGVSIAMVLTAARGKEVNCSIINTSNQSKKEDKENHE